MLRNELSKKGLDKIMVNTVDGFQGQESKIVLLSCVRGPNERNTIGFLHNPQRMNVALTRAQQTLIILAHCKSLEVCIIQLKVAKTLCCLKDLKLACNVPTV